VRCCAERKRGFQKLHVTSVQCRNRLVLRHRALRTPPAPSVWHKTLGCSFLMFRLGNLQRQEPWTPFVVASVALALGLYYLHTTQKSPQSSASAPSQVNPQPSCQDSDADHRLNAMHAEERAYHERFMREAIAMVGRRIHFTYSRPNVADSSLH
jgi:hypothetical protein